MRIKEVTYEQFEKALNEILDKNLIIISHSRAGRGVKRIEHNQKTGLFTVSVCKSGEDGKEMHTSFSAKAAYQVYSNTMI